MKSKFLFLAALLFCNFQDPATALRTAWIGWGRRATQSLAGAVFEAAAIVGVRLFDADQATLTNTISANTTTLALLPKAVRVSSIETKDDF